MTLDEYIDLFDKLGGNPINIQFDLFDALRLAFNELKSIKIAQIDLIADLDHVLQEVKTLKEKDGSTWDDNSQ